MFKLKILISVTMLFLGTLSNAGTIIFQNKTIITDVEILNIENGKVLILKDKTKQIIDINQILAYYEKDLKNPKPQSGKFADYTINLTIEMPSTDLTSKKNATKFKIGYKIIRTGINKEEKKVKTPLFYLNVLTIDDDTGEFKNTIYSCPTTAKIRSYDKAEIIDKLNNPSRKTVDFSKVTTKDLSVPGEGIYEISISNLKTEPIIAYRLEVWGNDIFTPIETKEWVKIGAKVEKDWVLK